MSNKPFKVFLSPSNQSKNWCKMGHSEKEHCEALVQKMIPYLEKYGIEYKIRKDGQSMQDWVNEATAWGSQLHVPIHTNAATTFARGTRFGYYPGRSDSAAACNIFKKHWVKLYPNPAKVKTTTYTFFEARTPKMPSVYVELIFHDNKEDAAWFHQYMDAAAKTLVDAIADYFGVYTGSDAQPMRSPADGRIVKVRIEKEENARYLGVPVGTVISLPIEEYLMGVVPQEVSNWHVELCKAQAIAARSIACYWTRNGQTITDTTTHQAYNAQYAKSTAFPNAHKGVRETKGQVLMYNGQVAQTYYAASNGGQMIASDMYWNTKVPYEQRQHIPYLVTKDDPWTKATGEPLKGHPVGMSQYGARYAAGMGLDHKVILAFYYPGTTLLPETVYIPPVNPAPAPKPIPTKPITAIPEKYLYKATAATLQPFSLNIWTGISKYASLGKIPRGKEVYVLDIINDGWVRVQYGTKIGFVDRRYLHEPMRNDVLYRAEVKTFYPLSLNIWKEARKGQSLIKVPRGATIEVLKEVNQVWAQVRYGKYVGYSDMKYLKKVEDK